MKRFRLDRKAIAQDFNVIKEQSGKTLDQIASESNVSASTLSRLSNAMLSTSISSQIFLSICNWMQRDPSFYIEDSIASDFRDLVESVIKSNGSDTSA